MFEKLHGKKINDSRQWAEVTFACYTQEDRCLERFYRIIYFVSRIIGFAVRQYPGTIPGVCGHARF
jgi:hypothetical protein